MTLGLWPTPQSSTQPCGVGFSPRFLFFPRRIRGVQEKLSAIGPLPCTPASLTPRTRQNDYRSANWIVRGATDVLAIVPNEAEFTTVLGLENCA